MSANPKPTWTTNDVNEALAELEVATALPWPRLADDGTPLGIDLGKARKPGAPPAAVEVRKLVGKAMSGANLPLDVEDVSQEVCLAIVRRNACASAFDPRKASFGKYVYTVCSNVIGHMLEARRRFRKERPVEEVPELMDDRDPIGALEDSEGFPVAWMRAHIAEITTEEDTGSEEDQDSNDAVQLDLFGVPSLEPRRRMPEVVDEHDPVGAFEEVDGLGVPVGWLRAQFTVNGQPDDGAARPMREMGFLHEVAAC